MNQITPSDLQLFADAQAALQSAQATLQFVSNHLTKTYQLSPQDQVDLKTGVITKPTPPSADPATAEQEV
jgi:hypothetical protein